MTIHGLVFIVGFMCAVGAVAIVQASRGQGRRAGRTLVKTAAAAVMYLVVVAAVSLATPRQVLPQSEHRCWDEWCLAVERVMRTDSIGPSVKAAPDEVFYLVDVSVSSLARGRSQRERGVVFYLLNASGRRFNADSS